MGHYDRFESEDDVYEFCIERRRAADAMVRAEELRLEREKGFEEGKQEGDDEGILLGTKKTETRLKALTLRMIEDGRVEELRAAAGNPELQKKVLAEYQL